MVQENSAHGAPRGSIARVPTGFRRITPGLLKADRAAEKFTGFPEGVTSHGQLLAAFKAAAPRLGISPRLVHAVDYLFCYTKPQDWKADSRPIVWPSNEILGATFGLSERQVQEITRRLIELGLVTMKDSPNGKRYGNRHPNNETGRITQAYGFDLSLFAVRHAEFVLLAAEQDAERKAMRSLRRRRTIAHKGIIQILDTAREYGFDDEEWVTLSRETRDLVRALKDVERLDEMEAGVTSLERRWQEARHRIETLLKTEETAPKDAENCAHYYNYKPTHNLNKESVIAAKECRGVGGTTVPQSPAPVHRERPERGMVNGITPDELVRLAPKLVQYLQRPEHPTWPELIAAADEWLRLELNVSKSLWGDACVAMGRELAAIALAIVSTRELGQEPGQIHTSYGGYFHGVVAKHAAGKLHLERTVWDLRHKIDPERYAARSRSRRRNADDGREYRQ
jgi:replication initiation protein RepC